VPYRSNYTRSKKEHFTEDAYRYRADAKACASCSVREFCTSADAGRTLHRPARIDILERAHTRTRTERGRNQKKLRRWMMEGSFAHQPGG
jgi:hypothetical protein